MNLRIGQGYDVHRIVEGRKLILGGVCIPWERGLLGHSDADVLVHAVIDSLLGAANLGDIGQMFPDSDAKYKDADSILLLSEVCCLIKSRGFDIINIDSTVIAQKPKLAPYIDAMKQRISAAAGIDSECVSVKATTEEGLGFTGALDGMSATAICLLAKQ